MTNSKIVHMLVSAIIFSLLLVSPAQAEDKAARRAALLMRKMQADMQAQLDAQKATFEQEKQAMAQEIAEQQVMIDDLTGTKASLGRAKRRLTKEKTALETQNEKTNAALEAANAQIEELNSKLKSTEDALAFSQEQRKTILANLGEANQSLSTCEARNQKLYAYGSELIDFYESPKAVKAIKDKPSFLQSKRVVLDNLLQSQQDLLDENRFEFD